MKVAILAPELLVEGGGGRQALYLARELQEMGHEVAVYTPTYDRERCYPDICSSLKVVVTGKHPLSRLPLRSGRLKAYFNMRRLARKLPKGLDIINPHHWPPHWSAVWAARRIRPRPAVVWMCNDPPWPPATRCKGVRRVFSPLRCLSRRVFLAFDREQVDEVSKIVVLSEYAKGLIDATYGNDSAVVRSGVDVSALQVDDPSRVQAVRERYGIPFDTFLLLSLGILMPHRRIEDALEAVATAAEVGRDLRFLVVGTPEQYPEYAASLRRMVRNLRIEDHVIFAGAVPEGELKYYYHACDAFVFPNENQTWSLATTEAMACSRPVIVSTGAAVKEVLTNGVNALLVPPRRPDLMAEKLVDLIDSPERRRELAENGYRFIVETLSWRRYAESMVDVFEESIRSLRAAEDEAMGRQPAKHGEFPAHS